MLTKLKNILLGLFICKWSSERPSIYLWIKFCLDSELTLSAQSKLVWASKSLIEEFYRGKFIGHQEISQIQGHDRALVKKSLFREVAQVRLHTEEGILIDSPAVIGGMKKVSNADELAKIVHCLSFRARKLGLKVTEVEIAHSHKGLELLVIEGNRSQLVMNGLSQSDQKTGAYLGARLHYPLRIKAITDRLSYSMIF
ncbi:MAG: hypothetical protein Fur0010_06930 [Bdellovibrio sp.]